MTVYLVGAGPGDPGLLTLRAAELLARADVLVHDRLVDERVLALAPSNARRHDVGKRPGGAIRQDEINELLVSLAGQHSCVVRLKGGDPYVFGRGGEEALALQAAGVDFEVVPGVSSVNGVLAYAGIPVTHRGLATSYCVVTGHGADGSASGGPVPVDWEALARVGGTIVVLMGVAHREEISKRLIDAGRDSKTPVAIVEHGTLGGQRTLRTTLGALAATDPGTPAIIVIGAVASLDLAWFERKPLLGWRVIVTRSRDQASVLARCLAEEGALPIEVPTIEIAEAADGGAALRASLDHLGSFDWVAFSSANAVRRVFGELRDARALGGVRVAAVGAATAAALREHGIVTDLVAEVAVAEGLARAFDPAPPGGASVLLPQAAGARDVLAAGLTALGYRVETVEAYRTIHPALDELTAGLVDGADAITFSSSSTVEGYLAAFGLGAVPPVVASIGPVTTETAKAHGIGVAVQARAASVEGLVEALVEFAASHPLAR
ncbi:MAG: uroporphyrinogen-III C-methyltransferase [Acidimicrobiales bacterium]